jgi:hypothetical protein
MTRGETRQLLARLTVDADRICVRFGLRYRSLEAERANVKRRYGICYSDGSIKIRLRHATSGVPLKYSSLVNTLCHELPKASISRVAVDRPRRRPARPSPRDPSRWRIAWVRRRSARTAGRCSFSCCDERSAGPEIGSARCES